MMNCLGSQVFPKKIRISRLLAFSQMPSTEVDHFGLLAKLKRLQTAGLQPSNGPYGKLALFLEKDKATLYNY